MSETKPRCDNCIFSQKETVPYAVLYCRRYPPTYVQRNKFPEVHGGDWCGEFVEKDAE